jgi:ketosteroid isomerase-like protein
MKRILEIGVYRPGDLTSEVTAVEDVNLRADGDTAVFTGHATVKSRFKGKDFSSLYRLGKVYEKQQGRWRVVASRTARMGGT